MKVLVAMTMSAIAAAQFIPSANSPIATGHDPVSIATGDFNGDGISDLAIVNSSLNLTVGLTGSTLGVDINCPFTVTSNAVTIDIQ